MDPSSAHSDSCAASALAKQFHYLTNGRRGKIGKQFSDETAKYAKYRNGGTAKYAKYAKRGDGERGSGNEKLTQSVLQNKPHAKGAKVAKKEAVSVGAFSFAFR